MKKKEFFQESQISGICLSSIVEEREKPELLAESPARRKRIAQDSGRTEQQVRPPFYHLDL